MSGMIQLVRFLLADLFCMFLRRFYLLCNSSSAHQSRTEEKSFFYQNRPTRTIQKISPTSLIFALLEHQALIHDIWLQC